MQAATDANIRTFERYVRVVNSRDVKALTAYVSECYSNSFVSVVVRSGTRTERGKGHVVDAYKIWFAQQVSWTFTITGVSNTIVEHIYQMQWPNGTVFKGFGHFHFAPPGCIVATHFEDTPSVRAERERKYQQHLAHLAAVKEAEAQQAHLQRKAAEDFQRAQEEEYKRHQEAFAKTIEEESNQKMLAMHEAVRAGDQAVDQVKKLLNERPNLATYRDIQFGQMPIHLAASLDLFRVVDALLMSGRCKVDEQSRSKRTACHEAAHRGHLQTIRVLIGKSADVNARCDGDATPLMLACENGRTEVAQFLVQSGADIYVKNGHGKSAMDILASAKNTALRTMLHGIASQRGFEKTITAELATWRSSRSGISFSFEHDGKGAGSVAIAEACERIRKAGLGLDQWDCMHDTTFFTTPRHSWSGLYLSLGYASTELASLSDIEGELIVYEKGVRGPISVLFLLACARLAERRLLRPLQIALLKEFAKHAAVSVYSLSWMSEKERELARMTAFPLQDERLDSKPTYEMEWESLRGTLTAEQRAPMEKLLRMVGLEDVKRVAVALYTDTLADKKLRDAGHSASIVPKALNFLFEGNPGTGKTECARIFANLLEQSGARAGHKFIQMTGSEAVRKGARKFASELEALTGGRKGVGPPAGSTLRRGMAVEVRDSRNQFYPGRITAVSDEKDGGGYSVEYADGTFEEKIPRIRLQATEEKKNIGGVLFIDEAYDLDPLNDKEGKAIMNEIMAAAEDFRDHLTIILAGYKDEIQTKLLRRGPTVCEGGWETSEEVSRVAARRVARGIGTKGFGNARSVRKLFDASVSSAKIAFLKTTGSKPSIAVKDVIGMVPTPENVPELAKALKDLNELTGLQEVKKSVQQLVEIVQRNYNKELAGEKTDDVVLNRLFLGNPGTGKSTVALIYGRILCALRLLSIGDVVMKTASDFVGDVIGSAQVKTKAIIEGAKGKVLLIDEAYNLDDKSNSHGSLGFGSQALDVLVERVSGAPGEDIAVIMCGYERQMTKMLRDSNPGLSRRFDLKFAVRFADFSDLELMKILSQETKKANLDLSMDVKRYAIQTLSQQRALANFGNAGAVKTLLANAKERFASRIARAGPGEAKLLQIVDLDSELESRNPDKAFEILRHFGSIGQELMELGAVVKTRSAEGRSFEGLVNHMVFTGPPGTGKTTVARAMGHVLFSYGIIATTNVVETSAVDMVGSYVGHSRKIVEQRMLEARGGILFIDEAYELGVGPFGLEAIAQLIVMLTLPEFMNGKTVVILGGYRDRIHEMLQTNPGLKSRFTKYLEFQNWDGKRCTDLVVEELANEKPVAFSFTNVQSARLALECAFSDLSELPGWANARDAREMAMKIVRQRDIRRSASVGSSESNGVVEQADVENAIREFKNMRALGLPVAAAVIPAREVEGMQLSAMATATRAASGGGVKAQLKNERQQGSAKLSKEEEVAEEVAHGKAEAEDMKELEQKETRVRDALQAKQLLEAKMAEITEAIKRCQSSVDLKNLQEALVAKQAEASLNAELVEEALIAVKEVQNRLQSESQRRQALKMLSRCPWGYSWIKRGDLWICGGGHHTVSDSQLKAFTK